MIYDVKFFGGFFSTLCEEEGHKPPPTLLPQYKREVLIVSYYSVFENTYIHKP